MMSGKSNKTWRDHWAGSMAKNILGEMPVLGPFFLEPRFWDAVPKSLHSTCMFLGGVLLMSANPFGFDLENTREKVGVGSLYMGVGMWAGALGYHAGEYGVKKLQEAVCCRKGGTEGHSPLNPYV